jgi:ketosteroid isomerase-like protein
MDSEQAVRDLMARSCDAVARGDVDAWCACWRDDGVWEMPGLGPRRGVDALRKEFAAARAKLELCIQEPLFGWVEVSDPAATARWYVRETQRAHTGYGEELVGCYDDLVLRDEETWRFARRRFWVLYRGPRPVPGEVFRTPPPAAT